MAQFDSSVHKELLEFVPCLEPEYLVQSGLHYWADASDAQRRSRPIYDRPQNMPEAEQRMPH